MQILNCKILLFSEIARLQVVMKFIFGIIQANSVGVWHLEPIIEKKIHDAGCFLSHRVRNKIKIHMQLIFLFYTEEIIDINI